MNKEQRYIIGFGLVRIVIGLRNFWSVTKDYHLSRLYLYDLSLNPNSLDLVMSLTTLFEFVGMALGFRAFNMIGVRTLVMFCLIGVSIGFLNCHFVTSSLGFLIFYPFTTGFFSGISAIVIVYPLWKRYKNHAGKILASSKAFFILGIIPVFPLIKIVNPDDEKMEIFRGDEGIVTYPPSLAGTFSETMSYYVAVISGLGILGVLIMNSKLKNQTAARQKLLKRYNENLDAENPQLDSNKIQTNRISVYTQKLIGKEIFISIGKVTAVGLAFAVMTFQSIYYEHKYVELDVISKRPFRTLVAVFFFLMLVGWAYDRFKNFTFYFAYSALLLFLIHSWAFCYLDVNDNISSDLIINVDVTNHNYSDGFIYLYVMFSCLVNSIEIVIAMTLLKIANGEINCQFALKTFSMTAYGAVISCLVHIYYEVVYEKIENLYVELILSTGMILGAAALLFFKTMNVSFRE